MLQARQLTYIVGALTLLVVVLACALVYFARDEIAQLREDGHKSAAAPARTFDQDGAPAVKLSAKAQAASAIATAPVKPHAQRADSAIYGSVIGVQSLLELRNRYVGAENDARVVRAALARSEAEFKRAQALYRDEQTVSRRAMESAESEWKSDRARLAAAQAAAAGAKALMRQEWGEVLAGWAVAGEPAFERLARGEDMLLQMALPSGQEAPKALPIAPVGAESAREARFVSAALQADASVPGRTYLYLVRADGLRAGMRVTAKLSAGQARAGVAVPAAALVWHAGKAWVYVKSGAEIFVRRPVEAEVPVAEGWFTTSLKAGEPVVVSGAQLLLSEEFRYQIKDENED